MLTDTVLLARYISQDGYGSPTYATAVSCPARVQWTTQRFVDSTGAERVSRCVVFVDGDVVVDMRDKLVFEDGTSPPIRRIEKVKDEFGVQQHSKLYV
jgi:hypothetical protein